VLYLVIDMCLMPVLVVATTIAVVAVAASVCGMQHLVKLCLTSHLALSECLLLDRFLGFL